MFSRRGFLQGAVVAGAVALVRGRALAPATAAAEPLKPAWCDLPGWQPRATPEVLRPQPFTRLLPVPPRLSADPDGIHRLALQRADVRVLDGPGTPMLTFGGTFPGPLVVTTAGTAVVLDLTNGLDEPAVLHLHGGHTPAGSDGHVRDEIEVGATRRFTYPNLQRPQSLWYHDHLRMRTAERLYRGLAGSYVIVDPTEADLGLPVDDERDLVCVLTDRSFAADGTLVYEPADHHGWFGDVVLVNGADRPRAEVAAGPVRLRIVNASNARPYRLARADGARLVQIASDGGLLAAPTEREALELWPAERVELLVDLTGAEVGAQVVLRDTLQPDDPGLLSLDVVVAGGRSATATAPRFAPLQPLGAPEVTRTVTLDLDPASGRFLLNNHGYADGVVDVYARLGAVERWRLVNTTTFSHPIHLHLVSFRVSARSSAGAASPLRPEDDGWKDTVLVRPLETVELDARFDDHLGDFMWHCHILEHEDHDMMSQFRVVDVARWAGVNRVETAVDVSRHSAVTGGRVMVASGTAWRSALVATPFADALLLVLGDQLSGSTAEELRRLAPSEIVVVGGSEEVGDGILSELAGYAPTRRLHGVDAFATAAQASLSLAGSAALAYLATAADFPDALAAGAAALRDRVPVLLTESGELPEATAEGLRSLGVVEVRLAGGTAAIGDEVAATLEAQGYTVRRTAGPERFATAAAFAATAFPDGAESVLVANGETWADALTAGAATRGTTPLLLVGTSSLPPATAAAVSALGARRLVVVGGEQAVSLGVEAALAALLPVGPQE